MGSGGQDGQQQGNSQIQNPQVQAFYQSNSEPYQVQQDNGVRNPNIFKKLFYYLCSWVVVMAFGVVSAVIASFVLSGIGDVSEKYEIYAELASSLVFYGAIVVGSYLAVRTLEKEKFSRDFIKIKKLPRWKDLGYAFGVYFAYFTLTIIAAVILTAISGGANGIEEVDQLGGMKDAQGLSLALVFLMIVIIGPVAEEIMYRGYFLQGLLKNKIPVFWAIFTTSLMFGVAHLNIYVAIDTFVLALFMGYITIKSDTIWPAIFMHILKNLTAFCLLFFVGLDDFASLTYLFIKTL